MNAKRTMQAVVSSSLLLLLSATRGHSESWPTLDKYAANCVLIVKAKQVGPFQEGDGERLTFKVTETWKGKFDSNDFDSLSADGFFFATQGEHGVRIGQKDQEIVFFFTRHNQPPGKLSRHNTAFPIRDGKIVYASTSDDLRREMSLQKFKQEIAAAATEPAAGSSATDQAPEDASKAPIVALEGTLGVHPKFLYRYYVWGFGDGQQCALFGEEKFKDVKVGSWIRVEGRLGTRFSTGGTKTNPSPFPKTCFIYMDVESVKVLHGPDTNPNRKLPPR